MEAVNRRRMLQLSAALAAAPLVKPTLGQAQPASVAFDMATYTLPGLDADKAFAIAMSAAAKTTGRPAALACGWSAGRPRMARFSRRNFITDRSTASSRHHDLRRCKHKSHTRGIDVPQPSGSAICAVAPSALCDQAAVR